MQQDQLQQLRDIHLPVAPTWWPPAPGWWFVAALLLSAAAWAIIALRRAYRRNAPVRRARMLHGEIRADYDAGRLSPAEYAHASNALLKRLLIHGLGVDEARRASDDPWLEMLDRVAGEQGFTRGPGAVLGNDRFRPETGIDVPALHELITRLLNRHNLPARVRRANLREPESTAGQRVRGASPEPR